MKMLLGSVFILTCCMTRGSHSVQILKTIFNYVYAYVSACGYVNQCKCPGAGVTGIYEVPNMGAS